VIDDLHGAAWLAHVLAILIVLLAAGACVLLSGGRRTVGEPGDWVVPAGDSQKAPSATSLSLGTGSAAHGPARIDVLDDSDESRSAVVAAMDWVASTWRDVLAAMINRRSLCRGPRTTRSSSSDREPSPGADNILLT